jgi:hypothetical protein
MQHNAVMSGVRIKNLFVCVLALQLAVGPTWASIVERPSYSKKDASDSAQGYFHSQVLTGDFDKDGKPDTAEITTALLKTENQEQYQNAFVGVAAEFEKVLKQNPKAQTEIVTVVGDDVAGAREAKEFTESLPQELHPYTKTVAVERTLLDRLKTWVKKTFHTVAEHDVAYRSTFAITRLTINTTVTYLGLQKAFPYIPDEVAFKSALFAGVFSGTVQLFAPMYSKLLQWNRAKFGTDLWVWIGLEILFLLPSTAYLHMNGFEMEPMLAGTLGTAGGLFTAFMWRVIVSTFGQYPWDSAISGDKENRLKERPDDRHFKNLQTFYESLKFVSISALSVGLWSLTLSDSAAMGWVSNGGLFSLGVIGFMFQEAVYKGPKSKVRMVYNKIKNACSNLLGNSTPETPASVEVDGQVHDLNTSKDKAS